VPPRPSEDKSLIATAPIAAGGELVVGACVGRFVVVRTIGAGGMGVVVAAYDPVLDRQIALKLLRATDTTAGDELLIREAQAMARLSHPNVVAVHEAGVADHRVYLAMELIDGGTLRAWLTGARRSRREIRDRFVEAGRGLAAAHAAGLVHRDFKPDNVLVGRDGRARVTDFGLVRPSPAAPDAAVGDTTTVAGTPRYMAPEQHTGQRADARADQFAFCVALYEALWQADPFAAPDPFARQARVLRGDVTPPPPRELPARVASAVLRGLSVDPARRHPTMQALLDEIAHEPEHRWRWRMVAVGLAGASLATAIAVVVLPRRAPDPASAGAADLTDAPDPRRFLLGVELAWGPQWGTAVPRDRWHAIDAASLDHAVRAGATATQLRFAWSAIEPTRGARDWSYPDQQVAEIEQRGLEPFATVGDAPAWLGRDSVTSCGDPPPSHAVRAAFHEFYRTLAARYCGRVKYYELGASCGDQAAQRRRYATRLIEWYQAMRDGCSDLVLAVGALDCRWGGDPDHPAQRCAGWIDQLYADGAGDSFDAVAVAADGYRGDLDLAIRERKLLNADALRLVGAALTRRGDASRMLWLAWTAATADDALQARVVAATLAELRSLGNVVAARYGALTDLPSSPTPAPPTAPATALPTAPVAAGLMAVAGPVADAELRPRAAWFAFRDRALGPGVVWHGPVNPGMEYQGQPPTAQFTSPIPFWGPDGAWALHTRFPRPGGEVLGRKFGYYSAGASERFGQPLVDSFGPDRRYCFRSAAQGGYNRTGVLPYQLGYLDATGAFVVLRTRPVPVDARWRDTPGVCHATAATGPELGRTIAVRFGAGTDGGASDIWFDDLRVTSTPR
jgi:hypothetical protein